MCSLTIALAAVKGYMDYKSVSEQGKAQEAAYKAQERNAEMNAAAERRKQERIADKYAQEQEKLNDKLRLARGQVAAGAGASGLALTGSGLDILTSTQEAWQEDSRNLLTNQRYDNEASRVQETNFTNQANAYNAAAHNTRVQTRMKKFGSILNTATSMYGAYKGGASGESDAAAPTEFAYDGDYFNYSGGKLTFKDKNNYGWW